MRYQRVNFPRIIKVKLETMSSIKSNKFHNYMVFGSGTLLAISESLPFITDIKANGILDAVKKIREEYKNLE